MSVLTIAGSPARQSRSSALLGYVDDRLAARGIETKRMGLRDVPAVDLVEMRCHSEAVRIWRAWVSHAQALVIATPVYKASLGGGLKARWPASWSCPWPQAVALHTYWHSNTGSNRFFRPWVRVIS